MLEKFEFGWRNETILYVDWVCYSGALVVLWYIVARHSLLLSGHLQPHSLACGDCLKATCASLKQRSNTSESHTVPATAKPSATDRKKSIAPVILYGTFGCLFIYVAFVTERVICYMAQNTLGWLPFTYCRYAVAVGSDLYLTAKSCMYTVFVARLKQSFTGSKYALSEKLIRALYAAVIIFSVVSCGLYAVFARGKVVHVSNSVNYCEPQIYDGLLLSVMTFDIIFVSVVVYLFASSLSKMYRDFSKHSEESESNSQDNADILLLPLKYTTLSIVAVLSTMFSHLFLALATAEFVIPFDCVLNCAALLLMTGQWAPVYIWLCSPLLKCVVRTPCLFCTDLTEEQLSALLNEHQSVESPRQSHGIQLTTQ